jgi:hypothetical protein
MYFLLSGEGAQDFGVCRGNAPACDGNYHDEGPMAIITSQIVEQHLNFSFIESRYYGYVSKVVLVDKASQFKQKKKAPRLPGQKKPKETGYFYRNARALARCAIDKQRELGDEIVALLFRDSDGTASAGRGQWHDKWNSMIRGFEDEEFLYGVPMLPKPKSETWIICAVKANPYQGCAALESRSGNDNSPKSLKRQLAKILDGDPPREELCELVNDRTIDINRLDMPSFIAFKRALVAVLH